MFRQLAALALASAVGVSAFAAGYEKNIIWSGRHAGVGGTGAAWTSGPEALYFNPAGLVTEQGDRSATFNLSPTTSQFKAPVVQDNVQISGSTDYYLPFGLFYGATPTERLGYGAGIYVGGGSKATYGELDITSLGGGFTMRPTLYSDLAEIEASLGAGYKLAPGLKVGAAYRFAIIHAAFSSFVYQPAAFFGVVDLQELEGTSHGFRLGAQYQPEEARYGLGFQMRSGMNVAVSGNSVLQFQNAGGATIPTSGGGVTVHTTIPVQTSLGGYYDVVPEEWRAHAEYVWTQYSKVKNVGLDGTVVIGGAPSELDDLRQEWRDQHSVRLAGEYLKSKYPVRFGYMWTSAVENPDFPKAIFYAPGDTHTFTLGTGRSTDRWDFNVAADYNFASASGAPTTSTPGARAGEYDTMAAALHAGVTYKF